MVSPESVAASLEGGIAASHCDSYNLSDVSEPPPKSTPDPALEVKTSLIVYTLLGSMQGTFGSMLTLTLPVMVEANGLVV